MEKKEILQEEKETIARTPLNSFLKNLNVKQNNTKPKQITAVIP